MLKNILDLKGAQQLSKKEQNVILGGAPGCATESECNNGCQWDCVEVHIPNQNCSICYDICWACVDPNNHT